MRRNILCALKQEENNHSTAENLKTKGPKLLMLEAYGACNVLLLKKSIFAIVLLQNRREQKSSNGYWEPSDRKAVSLSVLSDRMI